MRRPLAHAFYLAVFALFGGDCQVRATEAPLSSPDVCAVSTCRNTKYIAKPTYNAFQLEPRAKVSDACASYADLDGLNNRLHPYVRNLANNTDFFSYYRLNLYNKKCPFWDDENGMCGNRACAVNTLENEEDIPPVWRARELSKLEGPKAQHPGKKQQRELQRPLLGELGDSVGESCVVEYDDECDDRDYCVPEDESASAKGDYVSLLDNPERFTGYSGDGAHQVWEAIYHENCFSRPSNGEGGGNSPGFSSTPFDLSTDQVQAAQQFKQVMKSHEKQQAIKSGMAPETLDFEDECLEKRVFYRVISGMHASISTHLCYDYLNQTTGEWGPNVECYKERLHTHPERISNLYFNYALLLRAVGKLRDYVQDYTFCTGDPPQDVKTKKMITRLADAIPPGPKIFDESVMFQDPTYDGLSLKEDFRNRFRNVSRIMDCVGCDKCRLWGKLQTNGFGTALKVLFEFGNGQEGQEKPLLRRTELVALINTLDKISSALKALQHFRVMVAAEMAGKLVETADVTPPSSSPAREAVPNFEDLDELDDFEDHQWPETEYSESISDAFWEELDLIFRAYKFVLKSWIMIPLSVPSILASELTRLYDFWLGRPVRPRTWKVQFPSKEDLFRKDDEL
ncbi:related to ERO1, required for disulfide bond formation in the ER [Lecanosticta acicola]|uniref:Related to ERO1, required for disulfide bond formation in the ER n=1 Tax=Lecanosticta acicola TaxID=111012 RepID=A0AAI8Z3Q2_9PEZI|nr:related to ERO1, required for disulfide bond formation in the ER [Lecanosticta acicola]